MTVKAFTPNTHFCKQDIEQLDHSDPLYSLRNEFDLPPGLIYLDGNSLGAMPRTTPAVIDNLLKNQWRDDLNKGWSKHQWLNMPLTIGDKIAQLVGADAGEVAACDSTSINLFKLLCAAIQMRPGRKYIVSETQNFPSDLYIGKSVEDLLQRDVAMKLCPREHLLENIDEECAVVILTHVDFRTGYIHDMEAISRAAAAKGALIIWDLSHSTGVLPVELNHCQVDFAVGCGYKYLNGGPGAPAFLFVSKQHQTQLDQPLRGWLGHENPFLFGIDYHPAAGIKRTLCGTPAVLSLAALEAAIEVLLTQDIHCLREKSMQLTSVFIQLIAQECAEFGFTLLSPTDAHRRGSQVSLGHSHAERIIQALESRNIIADFRAPNILRFGFSPAYVSYVDLWNAVTTLRDIMQNEDF